MSGNYVLQIEHLTKQYGQDVILDDINLAFYPGAKIGVLGRNGAGKSTLLKIMAGDDKDFMGEVRPAKNMTFGYFRQEPILDPEQTVAEAVNEAVASSQKVLDRFNEVSISLGDMSPDEMEKAMGEMERLQNQIDAGNLWELDRMVEVACTELRVPPMDAKIGPLSGGEKRRVGLAQLLLSSPDVILLDEPTNHLDAESVGWLEKWLANFPGTVVAVTHDRYFLDNVASWILEVDRQKCLPFEGNYTAWLENKAKRLEIEDKQESRRKKTLRQEIEWSRTSPKARATKNKARLQRLDDLQKEQVAGSNDASQITIPITRKLGDLVVRFENVQKAYGAKVLYRDLSFNLPPGGIVGVIGPNGAGKTTLFRLIMGEEQPDAGEITVGQTVDLAYIDQSRDSLDGEKTVFQEISGGLDVIEIGKIKMHARGYVGRFRLKGPDQQKLAGEPLTVYDSGEQVRCFAHVAEVVDCVIALMDADDTSGEIFNIGSDRPVSMNDLAAAVIERVGQGEVRRVDYGDAYGSGFEDVQRRVPSVAKLHAALGRKPEKPLGEILDDIITWKRGG